MEPCAHTGVKTVHAEGTCRCQVGACLVCGEEQGGRCGWSGVSGGGGGRDRKWGQRGNKAKWDRACRQL